MHPNYVHKEINDKGCGYLWNCEESVDLPILSSDQQQHLNAQCVKVNVII